ncbi:hypothetical protein GCM10023152_19680 [Agromyces bauzanensis]|uniref:Uncharacterized protein n=1 Tax=Agromyces bauzanensis TaxID=1308924 RepID=A0A917UR07_9MICO|nr:hypothetical protein GCM10011372_14740 [Agromyces bauzanensis]
MFDGRFSHDVAKRYRGRRGSNGDRIAIADYVVLHRVVCCNPDSDRLLGAAAVHARRTLVFSHPPRTRFTRMSVGIGNAMMRLRGREYRGYVHSPAAMYDVLECAGFRVRPLRTGPKWWVIAATRRDRIRPGQRAKLPR